MTRKKAFTLVELLVVVSIIALLLSILLPALGKAKKAAETVKCATNEKNIASGLNLYVDDFDGWMLVAGRIDPGDSASYNSTRPAWSHFLFDHDETTVRLQNHEYGELGQSLWAYTAMAKWGWHYDGSYGDTRETQWHPSASYVSGLDIFKCPSDDPLLRRPNYGFGRFINWGAASIPEFRAWAKEGRWYRLKLTVRPALMYLAACTDSQDFFFYTPTDRNFVMQHGSFTDKTGGLGPVPAGGKVNMLYADGHVETTDFTDLIMAGAPTMVVQPYGRIRGNTKPPGSNSNSYNYQLPWNNAADYAIAAN